MTDQKQESLTHVEAPATPGPHILIVDHQPLHQLLLQEQLASLGCVITLAKNSHDALQYWNEDTHDLLLIAVNLPDDAYALTQHLRHKGVQAPIIGMIHNLEEQQRCLQTGMNAVVMHPLSAHTLQSLLQRVMQSPIPKRYQALFRTTMSADLAVLEHALQNHHYDAAQIVLHRMAGALVVMGVNDLADAMQQLKEKLSHNTDGLSAVHTHATDLCAALRDVIH